MPKWEFQRSYFPAYLHTRTTMGPSRRESRYSSCPLSFYKNGVSEHRRFTLVYHHTGDAHLVVVKHTCWNVLFISNSIFFFSFYDWQEFCYRYKVLLPKGLRSNLEDIKDFLSNMALDPKHYQIGLHKVSKNTWFNKTWQWIYLSQNPLLDNQTIIYLLLIML